MSSNNFTDVGSRQDWGAGAYGAAWFGRSRNWSRSHFIFSSGAGAGTL